MRGRKPPTQSCKPPENGPKGPQSTGIRHESRPGTASTTLQPTDRAAPPKHAAKQNHITAGKKKQKIFPHPKAQLNPSCSRDEPPWKAERARSSAVPTPQPPWPLRGRAIASESSERTTEPTTRPTPPRTKQKVRNRARRARGARVPRRRRAIRAPARLPGRRRWCAPRSLIPRGSEQNPNQTPRPPGGSGGGRRNTAHPRTLRRVTEAKACEGRGHVPFMLSLSRSPRSPTTSLPPRNRCTQYKVSGSD